MECLNFLCVLVTPRTLSLFFLAGFETSSTALMFCLYELSKNIDIQSKARNVVQEAYKKHGTFTYEMMMDMPYIDQVLQGE